jgi:hypothetical protein
MTLALPTTLIPHGIPFAMTEDVEYALPTCINYVQATVAVEASVDGVTWAALTNGTTGVTTAANFVRCTTAASVIIVKRS